VWQAEHKYPFRFNTEASIDLAQDPELMELMVECNFDAVFWALKPQMKKAADEEIKTPALPE